MDSPYEYSTPKAEAPLRAVPTAVLPPTATLAPEQHLAVSAVVLTPQAGVESVPVDTGAEAAPATQTAIAIAPAADVAPQSATPSVAPAPPFPTPRSRTPRRFSRRYSLHPALFRRLSLRPRYCPQHHRHWHGSGLPTACVSPLPRLPRLPAAPARPLMGKSKVTQRWEANGR